MSKPGAAPPRGDPYDTGAGFDRVADYVNYAVIILIWGSAFYAVRLTLDVVPPPVSVAYRCFLAALATAALALYQGAAIRLTPRQMMLTAAQGVPMFGLNYIMFYMAVDRIPSGLVAVIFSTIVIVNVATMALVLRVRTSLRVMFAGVLGVIGTALVAFPDFHAPDLSGALLEGAGLTMIGVVVSSFGQIMAARNLKEGVPLIASIIWGQAWSGVFTVFWCLGFGLPFVMDWSWTYVSAMTYLVLCSSVAGFVLFLRLVERIGPARASYSSVLFPLVALTASILFEGLAVGPALLLGVALILVGNAIALKR